MHAAAGGPPFGDQLRRRRIRDVVDVDAAADIGAARLAELLLVDDHDVAGHAHLVRMPALADIDLGEHLRLARIGDVDDGRAAGRAHMADVERRALDPDLTAARAIDMRH